MEWIKPKTDWKSTDFVNPEDFNRIRNNILYVKSQADEMYRFDFDEPVETEKTYNDYPYAEIWNNLENSLKKIQDSVVFIDIGKSKTYSAFDPYIDYKELNRLESALLRYKNLFDGRKNIAERLAFTLGNYGGIEL